MAEKDNYPYLISDYDGANLRQIRPIAAMGPTPPLPGAGVFHYNGGLRSANVARSGTPPVIQRRERQNSDSPQLKTASDARPLNDTD